MNEHMRVDRHDMSGGTAAYEPPVLVVHGSVTELTQAQAAGNYTDRSYPSHTPVTSLTFS